MITEDKGKITGFEQTKLKKCQECMLNQALYVCPRCSFRSCCLECCVAHKKRTQCNGKRIIATNNNDFVPLSRMTDATLHDDYHFLEHVLQTVESNQRKRPPTLSGGNANNRKRLRQVTDSDQQSPSPPKSCHPLLQQQQQASSEAPHKPQAWNGGGRHSKFKTLQRLAGFPHRRVHVIFMSPGMQRALSNKSYIKKQRIFWTVEIVVHGKQDQILSSESGQDNDIDGTNTALKEGKQHNGSRECKFLTVLSEECQLEEALLQLIQQRQKQLRKLNARDPTIDALLSSMDRNTTIDGSEWDGNRSNVSEGYRLLLHQPRSRDFRSVSTATVLREALHDAQLLEFPTFHWVPECLCTQQRFPRLEIGVVNSETLAVGKSSLA